MPVANIIVHEQEFHPYMREDASVWVCEYIGWRMMEKITICAPDFNTFYNKRLCLESFNYHRKVKTELVSWVHFIIEYGDGVPQKNRFITAEGLTWLLVAHIVAKSKELNSFCKRIVAYKQRTLWELNYIDFVKLIYCNNWLIAKTCLIIDTYSIGKKGINNRIL